MTHVLEWSKAKNTLRTQPIETCLSRNRVAYQDDAAADYVPIYLGTRDDCDSAAQASIGTLKARATMPSFSPAEHATLRHICNGLQNDEIAEVMGVSLNTVKPRLRLLMAKTETRNRVMLAVTAIRNQWV